MKILIGDIEPHIAINMANMINDDIVLVTQYYSSYLFYKSNLINKRCEIYFISSRNKVSTDEFHNKKNETIKFYHEVSSYKIKDKKLTHAIDSIWFNLNKVLCDLSLKSIIIWNTTSVVNSYINEYAIKNNINRNILENGFFRPNTITLDYFGMNIDSGYIKFDSKISKNDIFKVNLNVNIAMRCDYLKYRFIEFLLPTPINIPFFSIKNKISDLFIYFKSKKKSPKRFDFDEKYVFLPLQLLEDSQNIFYSKYERYIDIVNDAISISKEKVVVKIHPLDRNKIECEKQLRELVDSKCIFITESDTEKLIKFSEYVICVNSTVGLEAINNKKKVYLLGSSIYENVAGVINGSGNKTIENFKRQTQIEFNLNKFNVTDLERLIGYLK
ncbi:capsular polysaccharide export protein, LipB/KpsS family [Aliivibrio fischeri]|uniref:capsular polysaccharide export protein, LipB/KpsS family n=1 Tax=Aliivibrio fischeri TaxID=668 RepID=UPI00084C48B1|nr:hypothetical protein [Aliivibrio fischeri]OED52095.1 hypothetical protein BEI47_09730 [Aliivibrio fischeri]